MWSLSSPYFSFDYKNIGTPLAVQQLKLYNSNAGGMDSISGWETKIPYIGHCGQKINKIGGLVGSFLLFLFA